MTFADSLPGIELYLEGLAGEKGSVLIRYSEVGGWVITQLNKQGDIIETTLEELGDGQWSIEGSIKHMKELKR